MRLANSQLCRHVYAISTYFARFGPTMRFCFVRFTLHSNLLHFSYTLLYSLYLLRFHFLQVHFSHHTTTSYTFRTMKFPQFHIHAVNMYVSYPAVPTPPRAVISLVLSYLRYVLFLLLACFNPSSCCDIYFFMVPIICVSVSP